MGRFLPESGPSENVYISNHHKLSIMIDISEKDIVRRYAKASGRIYLKKETIETISNGKVKKGDVFTSAKIAGMEGAKDAWNRLPYCHQIPLEGVDIDIELLEDSVKATCVVIAQWKTGVEMDALSGVTSALLTVWDMVKYIEKDDSGNYPETRITDVKVETKVKGHA